MENMYTGKASRNPNTHLLWSAIVGIALIVFGIYMYFDLSAWENSTEQKSLHAFLWFIYDIAGKFGVTGFFSMIGLLLIFTGYKKTKNLKDIMKETEEKF